MPTLAHNLDVRRTEVHKVYPKMVIGWIGDQAHQTEKSDHNPDSRGIVHAIDLMVQAGTPAAERLLAWVRSYTADLEYFIHNRKIYTLARGFQPTAYTGSDPHTNHIHISGRHGSTGKNSATGTGYDTKAERLSPPPIPEEEDDMALSDEDKAWITSLVFHSKQFNPATPGDASSYQDSFSAWHDQVNKELADIKSLLETVTATPAPAPTDGVTADQVKDMINSSKVVAS
jgi:hypothetical protein